MGKNAIVAFAPPPSNDVQKIMKHIITKRSENRYKIENMEFLLWIYKDDNLREEVLRYCFVERLHEAKISLGNNSDMIYV